MAAGISETSNGKIKTGIYHADVPDKEKESLHRRWRQGQIQVVCATIGMPEVCLPDARCVSIQLSIAFGLGIDMATVRFVLHHSVSSFIQMDLQKPYLHHFLDVGKTLSNDAMEYKSLIPVHAHRKASMATIKSPDVQVGMVKTQIVSCIIGDRMPRD